MRVDRACACQHLCSMCVSAFMYHVHFYFVSVNVHIRLCEESCLHTHKCVVCDNKKHLFFHQTSGKASKALDSHCDDIYT